MLDTPDDFDDLMSRAGNGDKHAESELVARYGDSLHRAVRRCLDSKRRLRTLFDSTDFMQMVWDALFERLRREKLREFRDPAHLVAFLIGIAKNKVAREAQRLGTKKRGGGREGSPAASGGEDALKLADACPSLIDSLVAREELNRLLEKHREEHREVFRLFMAGRSHEEIGQRLGMSAGHVARVLRKLYDEFAARLDDRRD